MARFRARVRQLVTPRESDNVTTTEMLLSASDGYPLAARIWEPGQSTHPVATALINSGAGISCRYYDHFASYLANNGIATLVYDYRGVNPLCVANAFGRLHVPPEFWLASVTPFHRNA